MKKYLSIFLSLAIIVSLQLSVQKVYAASATMNLLPSSGSFSKTFKIDLVIDGHGDRFNAAKATIAISKHFAAKDVIIGDCNFSFISTPSISNLSFEGVILGGSSEKCTVFTATLEPISKGEGGITLTDATVRQFGDAREVLQSFKGGTYNSTTESESVLGSFTYEEPKEGLYNLFLTILNSNGKPFTKGKVVLVSGSDESKKTEKGTNDSGAVQFANIDKGLYKLEIIKDDKKIDESIINVTGNNRTLILSIKIIPDNIINKILSSLTTVPVLVFGVFIFVIILIVVFLLFYRKIRIKKNKGK